jgi:hypothetical protein
MSILTRRGFLGGLIAVAAAPALTIPRISQDKAARGTLIIHREEWLPADRCMQIEGGLLRWVVERDGRIAYVASELADPSHLDILNMARNEMRSAANSWFDKH